MNTIEIKVNEDHLATIERASRWNKIRIALDLVEIVLLIALLWEL